MALRNKLTTTYNIDVDESEDAIYAGPAELHWIHCINLGSATRYLKLYDALAADVTVGTTTPLLILPIPAQSDSNGAGFMFQPREPIPFATGVTVAATTGVAVADTGAPGANEVVINYGYRS